MASVRCSFVTGSLGLAKICPKVWKGFWATLTLWLFKILSDGFRNTLYVRNNSKTSHWFPFITSVTVCNWFLAVTEKWNEAFKRLVTIPTEFRKIFFSRDFCVAENFKAQINPVCVIEDLIFKSLFDFGSLTIIDWSKQTSKGRNGWRFNKAFKRLVTIPTEFRNLSLWNVLRSK